MSYFGLRKGSVFFDPRGIVSVDKEVRECYGGERGSNNVLTCAFVIKPKVQSFIQSFVK